MNKLTKILNKSPYFVWTTFITVQCQDYSLIADVKIISSTESAELSQIHLPQYGLALLSIVIIVMSRHRTCALSAKYVAR